MSNSGAAAASQRLLLGQYRRAVGLEAQDRAVWRHTERDLYVFYTRGRHWDIGPNYQHIGSISSECAGLVNIPVRGWRCWDGDKPGYRSDPGIRVLGFSKEAWSQKEDTEKDLRQVIGDLDSRLEEATVEASQAKEEASEAKEEAFLAKKEASTLRGMRSKVLKDKADGQRKLKVAIQSCSRRETELQEQMTAVKLNSESPNAESDVQALLSASTDLEESGATAPGGKLEEQEEVLMLRNRLAELASKNMQLEHDCESLAKAATSRQQDVDLIHSGRNPSVASALHFGDWVPVPDLFEMSPEQKRNALMAELKKRSSLSSSQLSDLESEGDFKSLVGLAHIAIVLATVPDRGLRLAEEELRFLNYEDQRKTLVDYLVSSPSIPSWLGDVTARVQAATDADLVRKVCRKTGMENCGSLQNIF